MTHILLVDDDPLLRRSLAFNLEQAGYQTSTAESAEVALAIVRRQPPDLILLDIGLPGMDGLAALYQFRRQLDVPVIFLTARRRELDEILGLEMGADDYVTKPFDFELMLLQPDGQLLATTDLQAGVSVGEQLVLPDMSLLLAAEEGYLLRQAEEVIIYVPVLRDEQLIGLVGLSQELDGATAGLPRLRYLLAVALAVEFLLAMGLGWWLALRYERDLTAVTTAVADVGQGTPQELVERGPTEFRAYNQLIRRLADSEAARKQLLANTIHELARPLGALRSAIQALHKGGDADVAFRQELLAGMDAQIERLQPLLDNLVALHSQTGVAVLALNCRPTPLTAWLRQVAVPWQAAAQHKGLTWQVDIPAVLPTLMIDPDRLAQAVGNLLSNGVRYTPTGGQLWLAAVVKGAEVWISVRDTGPGIPLAEQEHIFELLYRGAGTRFPQGMGLGLTIARELVQAHHGRLQLTSTPGVGSQFTISLPCENRIGSILAD